VKRCFIDCSEQQQPNEQTGDLPMTTEYVSIDPSSSPEVVAYDHIQKPHNYENVDATVPVYSN